MATRQEEWIIKKMEGEKLDPEEMENLSADALVKLVNYMNPPAKEERINGVIRRRKAQPDYISAQRLPKQGDRVAIMLQVPGNGEGMKRLKTNLRIIDTGPKSDVVLAKYINDIISGKESLESTMPDRSTIPTFDIFIGADLFRMIKEDAIKDFDSLPVKSQLQLKEFRNNYLQSIKQILNFIAKSRNAQKIMKDKSLSGGHLHDLAVLRKSLDKLII